MDPGIESTWSWRHTKQYLRFLALLPFLPPRRPVCSSFFVLSCAASFGRTPRVAILLILCKHRGLSLRVPDTQVYVVPVFKQLSRLGGPFFGKADATRVVPHECQWFSESVISRRNRCPGISSGSERILHNSVLASSYIFGTIEMTSNVNWNR